MKIQRDGYKTISSRDLVVFGQDEENQRNDLRRNTITLKIISRQFDDVLAENCKSQQKEFCNHLIQPHKNGMDF